MLRRRLHIGGLPTSVGEELQVFSSTAVQKRFSFKYATKLQHDEMRQPFYIHEKRYGIFSNERNVGKSRRGLPFITPLYTRHMNLWETDTDAKNNRFFREYVFGQRELHQLLGRPHGFEAANTDGSNDLSAYETHTDQRYKGIPRPAITNLHYEPEWCQTLYRAGAHGAQLSNPRSPLTEEVLGPELLKIRDIKSLEHCKAWFARLQYLIQLHYDAVGDIGEFKSRHTQHVHEFFVAFHDALSSVDFRDTYLFEQFQSARPAALEDLFGIFLEMEGNYVDPDHCPRCSLPYSSTRYCGEGDANTPFRRHRGRWAPHQRWGREWFAVVARRAEALWHRATEDPYFGTGQHTQRQAEALLRVYVRTQQRGKALDFIHALRGSKEFLIGAITITPEMQKSLDHLLDTTPHPHLLTNSFTLESQAARYTGEVQKPPFSPLQFRIDMEMNKYRRQQKEEGVVRVPPALWRLDTSAIVPYKIDPKTKHIVNWREVKEGIEKSFLSTGLPKEAYTGSEWREILYLNSVIATRATKAEQLQKELEAEKAKMKTENPKMKPDINNNNNKNNSNNNNRSNNKNVGDSSGRSSMNSSSSSIVFPDKDGYRVFDTTPASLQPFRVSQSGALFKAIKHVYPSPEAVPYSDPIHGKHFLLDTTPDTCRLFGDFEHGDWLAIRAKNVDGNNNNNAETQKEMEKEEEEVIVVGVTKEGSDSEWQLCAMYVDPARQRERGLVFLGTDCVDIRDRWASIRYVSAPHVKGRVTILDSQRTAREEFLGQVVGVRNGVLFVQWRLLKGGGSVMDRSVAEPIGTADQVREAFLNISELSVESLEHPPSWQTPFRNDFAEERLKELKQAPFQREKWVSLIPGKYTPKRKRFGYTQHTTLDDFETKEYKDRLLSKQFFHNPQAFEVIPDRRDRAVPFGGKWEYQRTQGLPTVDRNELENGWSEVEPVSDAEMHVIEQALRDISGRRPGNFIKSPSKVSSLQLNETWWKPFEFGWEQHNKEQKALLDPTEQRLIDSAGLPFGGKIPPFGTSSGIGERIREIAEDYAKGFGLGPHGHSPSHDTSHYNTLGSEDERVRDLGYKNTLVRLFNEKLGDKDIHQWALEQCSNGEADVRQLLLSLHEWRERGRPPSLLLSQVLSKYLEEEITTFNTGIPENVPKLSLQTVDGTLSPIGSGGERSGTIWADVDPTAYALQNATQRGHSGSDEPFILKLLKRARLHSSGANFTDVQYNSYLENTVVSEFQLGLAALVGKGISPSLLAQKTGQLHRGSSRWSGNVIPFVKSRELAGLLGRMGVTSENISLVIRGLANCPEQESVGDDFAVPASLILSWGGPGTGTSTNSGNGNAGDRKNNAVQSRNEQQRKGSMALSSAIRQLGQQRSSHGSNNNRNRQGDDKMVVHVLEDLALRNDGLVMDIQYAIRENKRNPTLRHEFFATLMPVFAGNHEKVSQLYDDYCEGKYVPNISVGIEAFIAFLHNITQHPDVYPGSRYFEVDSTTDGPQAGQYTALKLLDPLEGPFLFDNIKAEHIETVERFKKHGILAGPTRAPATGFIIANSKSLNYFTRRPEEVVYVTTDADQGLCRALEKSAHYKVIAANPALQFLLNAKNGAGIVATFNRFFYRTMPMLSFYQKVLKHYSNIVQPLREEAQNSARGLARAMESERSAAIEEFRRNSERYWRNILDGRSAEQSLTGNNRGSSTNSSNSSNTNISSSSASAASAAAAAAAGTAGGRDLHKTLGGSGAGGDYRRGGQRQQYRQQQRGGEGQEQQQQRQQQGDGKQQQQGRSEGDRGGVRTVFGSRQGGSRGMTDLLSKLNTPKSGSKGQTMKGPAKSSNDKNRGGQGGK
ncbi:uncharacterized protein TM35_000101550 [Trypanosoma theileri]|uniref:Uncharacterized protein n=1 Tax=Trypanosoma theileri TaxID=67003 RepID=A0A1X0NYX5_9TRYP|nr:uncharacterized protein TM35_000101550 [Trypanosoma theileri]ORC89887.1 hypothetical protein TM35_000101550 [Trypanosoma theileri]